MPLTDRDRQIIHECLRAAVTGPFLPMWEFHTLFGLDHHEVADIAFSRLPLDDAREDVHAAINNALNMLTGYPHKRGPEVWSRFISAPPAEVRRILKKWKGTPTAHPLSHDVFTEME